MWNILWILVPVYGWLALMGYSVRIVREFIDGKFEKMPKMKAKKDFVLGLEMLVKLIPLMISIMVIVSVLTEVNEAIGGLVNTLLSFFVIPILAFNLFEKGTVKSSFEFKTLNKVFEYPKEYIVALVKSILLGLVFLLMSIILVGIPAGSFTKNIFLADFYGRRVKRRK